MRAGICLRCHQLGSMLKSGFDLPEWMLDPGKCAMMRHEDKPRVSWQALLELRRILDEIRPGGAVEHRHTSAKGDVDENSKQASAGDAAKSVRSSTNTAEMGDAAGGVSTGSAAPKSRSKLYLTTEENGVGS